MSIFVTESHSPLVSCDVDRARSLVWSEGCSPAGACGVAALNTYYVGVRVRDSSSAR